MTKPFYLSRVRGIETNSAGAAAHFTEPRWMTFTDAEQTEKKYTVGFAVDQAKLILNAARRKGQAAIPVCMNSVHHRDLNEKITLFEVNRIHEVIVSDSFFFDRNPGVVLD